MAIHAADQQALLQGRGAARLHTHLQPRDASHILHRALNQDLQNPEEVATINALLDEEDQTRVVDQHPGLARILVPQAVHLGQQEAHPMPLVTVQDPIQNLIRAHLVMTNRQLVQTNSPDRIRDPLRRLVNIQSAAPVETIITRIHARDRVPNHLPDQLVGHQPIRSEHPLEHRLQIHAMDRLLKPTKSGLKNEILICATMGIVE